MSGWVVAHDSPGLRVENVGGVWWFDLPAPSRLFHRRHRAQTRGFDAGLSVWTYRCACGATSWSDMPGQWTRRER